MVVMEIHLASGQAISLQFKSEDRTVEAAKAIDRFIASGVPSAMRIVDDFGFGLTLMPGAGVVALTLFREEGD